MTTMIRCVLTLALAASAAPALADHGSTFNGLDDPRATERTAPAAPEAGTSMRPAIEGGAVAASLDTRKPSDRALGDDPFDRAMDFGG
jgi:hypothetical protein